MNECLDFEESIEYYHGRYGSDYLRGDVVIQWSQSLDTAISYASKNGSVWKLTNTKDFIHADRLIPEIISVIEILPGYPDWIFDPDEYEENPDEYLSYVNPKDIVSSAGFWDNTDFVEWFVYSFDYPGVITDDGAVTLSVEAGSPEKIERKAIT